MTFPANSRYATTPTATLTRADGTEVTYLLRRFVPAPEALVVQQQYRVADGDRLDNLAAVAIGDPELAWRIADANRALRPEALVETVGRTLDIPLPDGIPGPPRV